jgi:hypothetical protein
MTVAAVQPSKPASQIVKPLHLAEIAGRAVPFFRAPIDEPDLPWVPIVDLVTLCGLTGNKRHRQRYLHPRLKHLRDIVSSGGVLGLAPDWMARDMIRHAVGAGTAERAVYDEFKLEASLALRLHMLEMPSEERAPFAAALERRRLEREQA